MRGRSGPSEGNVGRGHGDRLSALDASFLRIESARAPMHSAGLFIFDPSDGRRVEFEFDRFIALVRSRLHLVPRFRQRLAYSPGGIANPVWVDDEQFDVSYHVRHAALPRPGRTDQLTEYVGRLISRPLDRNRPLWELYVIEGLEDRRIAYLGKTHHALVDGVTGVDIASLLLDFSPETEIPPPRPWHPSPRPTGVSLAWSAVKDQATSPRSALDNIARLSDAPRAAARRAFDVTTGIASMARANLNRGPRSPLNHPIGAFRRVAVQRIHLEDVKKVKNTFGTSVNDVVLAAVGDAVGRFLRARGDRTDGMRLKVLVPVSVRSDADRQLFGNRVSSVTVRLPVDEMDPVERLEVVHEEMVGVKEHHHAVGAEFLVGLTAYAPPTMHALAARVTARTRMHNLVVTNVPGPQETLYSLGMRLLAAFPIVPLTENHQLAVGVTSLSGWLNVGFTGDWDGMPDLENLTVELVEAVGELVAHADAANTRAELARRPTSGSR